MPTAIKLCPCDSSRIAAHGYDPDTNTLALQFKGRGGTPGPVYHYDKVEPELYEDLKRAESLGKFFGERINVKDDAGALKYPFTRIEEPKEE